MASRVAAARVSRLPLAIMAAVVVVAALVTIALSRGQNTARYEEGTPEAVLQRFVEAGIAADEDAMLELLVESRRAACVVDLRDEFFDRSWSRDDIRAELAEIDVDDETARATVRFDEGGGDSVFGDSMWTYERRFVLVKSNGMWLVERAGWPPPFDDCTR